MLVDIIGTDLDTCRTLVYPCSQYMVGGNNTKYNAFIQLEIAILPGRDVQLRKHLGEMLLNSLKTLCRDSNENIDFIFVVVETDIDFYFGL